MKKTNSILVLLFLLFLASCGQGGNTSATLKVSSSFALSNSGFDGGFVLYGKNGNQSFSRAVPYSAGSAGNVVDIVLPNGKWTFYATAWDDLGNGPMTGNIFCGEISTDLLGADKKVNLSVSQASCDSPSFVNTAMRETTGPNKVKKLGLISCNGFYEWSTGGVPTPIIATTAFSFCSSNNVPLDFRNKAPYFKVKVMSKSISNGVLSGELSSDCLPFDNTPANGVNSVRLTDLRIPSSNTPVHIGLYRDSNCTDSVSQQPMLEGLSFNYGDDKFFLNNVGHGGLVIASNQTRKGYSNFIDILPSFKCDGKLCIGGDGANALSSSYDYYAARSSSVSGSVRVIIDRDEDTPAANYSVTPAGNGWTTSASCSKSNDEYYCDFNLESDGSSCTDTPNHYCWSDAGKTFSFSLTKNSVPMGTKNVYVFKSDKDLHALSISLKLTGFQPGTPKVGSFDRDLEDSPNGDYGALDLPRMLLSPEIGGMISLPGQNCSTAIASRQLRLQEDGETKEYEISVNNASGIPVSTYDTPFFCNSSNADLASCAGAYDQSYEKRISVKRKNSFGSWELFLVADFSCDPTKRSGRVQEINKDYFDGTSTLERKEHMTLAWFTPPAGNERLEIYRQEFEYNTSSQVTDYEAGFTRMYKLSNSDFEINGMHYSRRYSTPGTTYEESAARYFTQKAGGFLNFDFYTAHRASAIDSAATNTNLFTDTSFSDVIESTDFRTATSVSSITTKFDLASPYVSPISATFNGYGPTATSVESLPMSVDQLRPTQFSAVFSDGFFP